MKNQNAILVAATLLVIDRVLKLVTIKGLLPEWSFFDAWPRLAMHRNFGIAFDLPLPRQWIIAMTATALIILVALAVRAWRRDRPSLTAIIFIIAGAASNLADRILYGFVVDMIEVFPRSVWNVADLLIIAGVILLIFRRPVEKMSTIPDTH